MTSGESKRIEHRYQAIFEDPNILAGVLDTDGTLLEVNQTALEYIDAPKEAVVGEPIWKTAWWNEEVRDSIREKIGRAADGNYVEYETEHTAPSGESYYVEGVIRPVSDDGKIVSLIISARDVTERKLREAELRAERAFVDQALDTLEDVFYVVAPDGTLRRWNERLPEVTGYDDADIAEMNALDFFVEDDRDRVFEALEEVITTGEAVIESEVQTAEGGCIPYELVGTRLDDLNDRSPVVVGIARDITERKEREQTVERLHETARNLIDADSAERIAELAVETARDVLELPLCSIHLVDQSGTELAPVAYTDPLVELVGDPPPSLEADEGIAGQVFETGEPKWYDDVSTESDRLNEQTEIRSEILLPLRDRGVFIASSPDPGAFDEVTVRVAEILAAHAETALDRVRREEKLVRQNERLEKFASVISHDLRNPLNVAQGHTEQLREEYDSEHLDDVAYAHDRIDTLIEDLLALARSEAKATDPAPADLSTLAGRCWTTVQTADATLRIESDRTVYADESRLKQLFENMFRNAVEHGGETVSVTVGELEDGFYIEDDGDGIPGDIRGKLFATGASTGEDGTGLGLGIVEQIVEAHGWSIRAMESADGGARFEITDVEFVS